MKSKATEKNKQPENEALADALAAIHKNYGEGSIMRMGERPEVPEGTRVEDVVTEEQSLEAAEVDAVENAFEQEPPS